MQIFRGLIGLIVLVLGTGYVPAASAQEVRQPDIGLTLTEALKLKAGPASTRDDYREVPPPKNDRLSDTARVTVTLGSPQCFPGEDGWVAPPPPRGITAGPRPGRFR